MKIVALFRVSTEKQAEYGASLDAQERIYHELAARHGWTTVGTFRGTESATQAAKERKVLQQALQVIRDQPVDGIWVIEQSRLTRGDEADVGMLFRELEERQVKIIIGSSVRDLSSIDERFMIGVQSLVDRAESKRIKERLKRGKTQRAHEGKKNSGPAPFGYRNPPPGAEGRGTLVIVEPEAAVVRRIFALAASGKGDRAIAQDLNQRGLAAPRGGKWVKTSVRRTLTNPAYVGTQASGAWRAVRDRRYFRLDLNHPGAIVRDGAHPAIVTREQFDAVNKRAPLARTRRPLLLTGLLWVGGEKFGADWSRDRQFYRGPRGLNGLPWLATDTTDAKVWDAFVSLATEERFVEQLMRAAESPDRREIVEAEIAHLKEQIAKVERRVRNLVQMRADDDLTHEDFRRMKFEAEESLVRLRADLETEKAKLASMDSSHAPRVVRAVRTLLTGKTRLSTEQKRALLASLVGRVDVNAERSAGRLRRDEQGRVLPGSAVEWAVKSVAFRLNLPQEDEAPREVVPNAEIRDRQLDLSLCDCVPLSGTEAGCPGRQKDTTFFGCAPLSVTVEVAA